MAKVQLTTPKGEANFVFVQRKNNKDRYSVSLVLDPKDEGYKALEQQYLDAEKDFGKAYRGKPLARPYKDRDGNETDLVIINFTGSLYKFKMFDAAGNAITDENFDFGRGSKIKITFVLSEYESDGNKGLSKFIKGIQVIEYVENGVTAADCGFAPEEGYSYQPQTSGEDSSGEVPDSAEEVPWEE